jgi:hypothetical protein
VGDLLLTMQARNLDHACGKSTADNAGPRP